MNDSTGVYIAMGSNRDPVHNLSLALRLLAQVPELALVSNSSWYRTLPWGIEDQPEFINLVVGIETRLTPRRLLQETQGIEERLGRERTLKNGPRTIDLDILLFGNQVHSTKEISIPHPGLLLRDFMLVPLIEIAPDAVHPVRCLPVSQLHKELRYRQIVDRIPAPTAAS